VTDKTPSKAGQLPPEPCSDDEHERPTISPPFDVAAFAREQMAPGAELPRPDPFARETRPGQTANSEAELVGAIEDATGPEISEHAIDDPMAEMSKCFRLEDYAGALAMAELILAEDPRNLAAVGCRANCRVRLEKMYAARLLPDRVPVVRVAPVQLGSLSIDHRAGFVLSLIDGSSTVEKILDESGMPKLDVLRILHELVLLEIVGFA
jgi:hypothetical protein